MKGREIREGKNGGGEGVMSEEGKREESSNVSNGGRDLRKKLGD